MESQPIKSKNPSADRPLISPFIIKFKSHSISLNPITKFKSYLEKLTADISFNSLIKNLNKPINTELKNTYIKKEATDP